MNDCRFQSAVVMQASYYSVNSSSFKTAKKQHDKMETQQSPKKVSESRQEAEWNDSQRASGSSKRQANPHYDHLQQQHMLYGVTGDIGLTCRQQKIQMSSRDVYVVQDLYGMSTSSKALTV